MYRLKLSKTDNKSCLFDILERQNFSSNEKREIFLFQALPKSNKMDLIVRQAAESGVNAVIPLESDHSLIKLKTPKDRIAKTERWNRVVKEALQQSGSPVLTRVEEPRSFSSMAEFIDQGGMGFFCHQEERKEGGILPVLKASSSPAPLGIIIGPEGGLSKREVDKLEEWGYHSLYFGENVLRTETASLYAVAAIKTVLRELYL
jgi:16S rRNA (uracil1498-N3)-methyltransferase